jgi:hypothetical protein
VKRYALWKAQRGAAVSTLEQFQASISVPSTLKIIFLLRAFSWTSLGLVFLWSWYYLGSQAAGREYTYIPSGAEHKRATFFQAADAQSIFSVPANITSVGVANVNALFGASFISQGFGHDSLGGALIPMLDQSEAPEYTVDAPDKHGWRKIESSDNVIYSARTGSLVYVSESDGTPFDRWLGHYQITTSYVNANCTVPVVGKPSDFAAGVDPTVAASFNVTDSKAGAGPSIDVWYRTARASIHSVCRLQNHTLDLQGNCDGTGCAIHTFRQTPNTDRTAPFTMFNDRNMTAHLLNGLLLSNGIPTADSPALSYVLSPNPGSDVWSTAQTPWTNSSTALAATLSTQTTLLLNTYLSSSQPWSPYDLSNTSVIALVSGHNPSPTIWHLGTGKGAAYAPQYHLSWPWLALDMATCAILFVAALVGFWLRRHTVVPDVFGYVSSMTRDNPHVRLPEGGSTLSGLDRARALKHVKVRIADLRSDSAVGRIGLTVADDGGGGAVGTLNESRQYV